MNSVVLCPRIMVHIVVGVSNDGPLRVAAGLAERMKSAVIGIAASVPMPAVYAECYSNEAVVQADLAELVKGTTEAESQFRAAMAGRCADVSWRSMIRDVPPSDYVAREARAADLVVTAPETRWFAAGSSHGLIVGDLVLKAGRPVLIAAETTDAPDLDDIVVAWKDTREARRAIADALPLLARADRVCVVEIATSGDIAAARRHLDDVAAWLGRHGITAKVLAVASTGDDAAHLRAIARERRAGTIVGGAYGHGRSREWAFGGVTRDLLLRPDRCSLVSH